MMETGICVLIITKNASRSIETTLNSLFDIADQIVIVDTGSTDTTLDIVRAHPLRPEVHKIVWSNDFSAARNTALYYCRYSWCLVLDADEYIDEECRPYVRHLIEEKLLSDPMSYYAPLIDNLNGSILRNNPRIFAIRNTLKYHGRVHEYITGQQSAKTIALHDIVIKHTGYLPDIHDQKLKHQRNLELLRLQIDEEPDVYRWKYFILRYLSSSSLEALAILEDFGRLPLPFPEDIEVYAFNAKSRLIHYYLEAGEWEKAKKQSTELLTHYRDYDSTLIYIYSSLYYAFDKFKNTISECEEKLSTISQLERDLYLHEITNPQLLVHLQNKLSNLSAGIKNDWKE